MPTVTDRHNLTTAERIAGPAVRGFSDAIRRRPHSTAEEAEEQAALRAFLAGHSGEQAARYVPLPRLIQE